MAVYYDFDEVDSFTVGAIGKPGQRTFLLQARRGAQRVTVKCEKQQAIAIADYLRKVLNDLPPAADKPLPSSLELAEPYDTVFVLGPIGLGYERASDRVLIQLDEFIPLDENGEPEADAEDLGRIRLFLSHAQMTAFVEQADRLVAASRPACRWCGFPMDPDGHACPRMN